MADFEFKCPSCGNTLEIDESHQGKKTTCPACRKSFVVPEKDKPAPMPRVKGGAPVQVQGTTSDLTPQEEKDVFRMHPAWRSFFWKLILAVLFPVAALVFQFFVKASPGLKRVVLIAGLAIGLIFFLVVVVKRYSLLYRLSTQRLFVYRGLISRRIEELELFRVRDIDVLQNFWERILSYGRMTVFSTDATTPKFEVAGMPHPLKIKDTIRTHFRQARIRERVRPTEFISDFESDTDIGSHDPSL